MAPSLLPASTIPSLTIGGRVITDLANLIILRIHVSNSGTNGSLRLPNGTAARAVTTGKTFTVAAIRGFFDSASTAGAAMTFGYADNDVGNESSTAFTNRVLMGGASGYAVVPIGTNSGVAENGGVMFTIPAGKFLAAGFIGTGGGTLEVYGYEA